MKVILLKELKGKGGEGDVIDVAPGFANNYLLTQGYAIKATKGNLKQLEQRRNNIAKREQTRIADAETLAEKLNSTQVTVLAQVGDEGQLFGSVTAPMIAEAIEDKLGIDVDRRRIELGKPIKLAGEHEVEISIYRNIKAKVQVTVVDSKAETAQESAEAQAHEADLEAAEDQTQADTEADRYDAVFDEPADAAAEDKTEAAAESAGSDAVPAIEAAE